jgi:hypothetical protein
VIRRAGAGFDMTIDPDLIDSVRRIDAQIRRLQDYGIELQSPGWVARLEARKQAMADMYAKEQRVREEVDRIGILPRLIDAYLQGNAQDREELRALQKECSRFGGGAQSRGVARPLAPVTAAGLLRAFAFLSMHDGDNDWRDEKIWLDHLCAVGRASGLDVAAVLREAATMASTATRGSRPSLSETLLARAASDGSGPA